MHRGGFNRAGAESLAGIRVERRAIAVAVFSGDHLRYADARQLSSCPAKAADSAVSFVARFQERFRFASAALESIPKGRGMRRSEIGGAVIAALQRQGIAVAGVGEAELLTAFGHPPLRFRRDLRKVVSRIYPVLDEALGAPWTHDAAALGLYVQTERLFNAASQTLL